MKSETENSSQRPRVGFTQALPYPTQQKQVWPRSWSFSERDQQNTPGPVASARGSSGSGLGAGIGMFSLYWKGVGYRLVLSGPRPVLQARALGDKGLGDGWPRVRPASDGEALSRQGCKFPRLSEPASLCVGPSTFSFPALAHRHRERLPRTLPGLR